MKENRHFGSYFEQDARVTADNTPAQTSPSNVIGQYQSHSCLVRRSFVERFNGIEPGAAGSSPTYEWIQPFNQPSLAVGTPCTTVQHMDEKATQHARKLKHTMNSPHVALRVP